jgi:hypothetical protein
MALWYLLNNIRIGTTIIAAGTLIDDAVEDATAIEAAGGRLVPNTTPGIAEAAQLAQDAKRRGAPPEQLEALMNAAIDDAQQSSIVSEQSGTTSLTTRVSTEESTRTSQATSLTTRVSTEESTRASQATSLTTRVSTEESTRTSADTSLTTRVSTAESTEASTTASLTTRVSTEESTRASQVASLTAGAPAYTVANLTTDRDYDAKRDDDRRARRRARHADQRSAHARHHRLKTSSASAAE